MKEQAELKVKQLVAFSVLMEGDGGILGKSPGYILEKYNACLLCNGDCHLESMLDMSNKAKYVTWRLQWLRE